MYLFFIIIHLIICFFLILSILFQASKGGALSGTFGGGKSGSLFGNRGTATLLSKLSSYLAVAFFVVTILISLLSTPGGTASESIIKREANRTTVPAAELPTPEEQSNTVTPE